MHTLHNGPNMIPGLSGLTLRDTHQKKSEEAKEHMSTNPFILAMIEGSKLQSGLEGPEGPFHFHELLIPQGYIFGTEAVVAGREEIFPIQVFFRFHLGPIN